MCYLHSNYIQYNSVYILNSRCKNKPWCQVNVILSEFVGLLFAIWKGNLSNSGYRNDDDDAEIILDTYNKLIVFNLECLWYW